MSIGRGDKRACGRVVEAQCEAVGVAIFPGVDNTVVVVIEEHSVAEAIQGHNEADVVRMIVLPGGSGGERNHGAARDVGGVGIALVGTWGRIGQIGRASWRERV